MDYMDKNRRVDLEEGRSRDVVERVEPVEKEVQIEDTSQDVNQHPLAKKDKKRILTTRNIFSVGVQLVSIITAIIFGVWAIRSYDAALKANSMTEAGLKQGIKALEQSAQANRLTESGLKQGIQALEQGRHALEQGMIANQLALLAICTSSQVSNLFQPWSKTDVNATKEFVLSPICLLVKEDIAISSIASALGFTPTVSIPLPEPSSLPPANTPTLTSTSIEATPPPPPSSAPPVTPTIPESSSTIPSSSPAPSTFSSTSLASPSSITSTSAPTISSTDFSQPEGANDSPITVLFIVAMTVAGIVGLTILWRLLKACTNLARSGTFEQPYAQWLINKMFH
ncbi:hypothetical protein CPB86DRAFT_790926 [Serendipita vermifera]|nr:hypothetical protein CPB86DRAFT_790926 [Serendipita vermifera]